MWVNSVQGREPVGNGHVVVAPLSLRGLAAPERRLRTGLTGVSNAKGVTSEGESAVLDGLRTGLTVLLVATVDTAFDSMTGAAGAVAGTGALTTPGD